MGSSGKAPQQGGGAPSGPAPREYAGGNENAGSYRSDVPQGPMHWLKPQQQQQSPQAGINLGGRSGYGGDPLELFGGNK